MTTATPLPLQSPRTLLALPALRASVLAMVRRRVPAPDAEDVVQSVLCDALAAKRTPADPSELERWVIAITRNKIADFHRRAHRRQSVEPNMAADSVEGQVPPAPVEARELLRAITQDTVGAAQIDTLDWIVREYEGDALSTIAREVSVPAPVVRQRVSRMRRRLRLLWAIAAAVGVFLVAAAARHLAFDEVGIVAEAPPPATPAEALSALAGKWRVVSVEAAPSVSPEVRGLVGSEARVTEIVIAEDRIVVESPNRAPIDGSLSIALPTDSVIGTPPTDAQAHDGRFIGTFTEASGRTTPLEIRFGDGLIEVWLERGAWRGRLALSR